MFSSLALFLYDLMIFCSRMTGLGAVELEPRMWVCMEWQGLQGLGHRGSICSSGSIHWIFYLAILFSVLKFSLDSSLYLLFLCWDAQFLFVCFRCVPHISVVLILASVDCLYSVWDHPGSQHKEWFSIGMRSAFPLNLDILGIML